MLVYPSVGPAMAASVSALQMTVTTWVSVTAPREFSARTVMVYRPACDQEYSPLEVFWPPTRLSLDQVYWETVAVTGETVVVKTATWPTSTVSGP